MALSNSFQDKLRARQQRGSRAKFGEAIFDGTDYPREWDQFIGQEGAKERMKAAMSSALHRHTRIEHTLLASGLHGVGKTTLAYLLAYQAGVSLLPVSGAISVDEARDLLMQLNDRDILFWDEFHLAVAGNRNRADWTLPLLTDGELLTANGAEKMPNVTIVAATTDAGVLPQTITSRFMVRPTLVSYTEDEAVQIVKALAKRMDVGIMPEEALPIARAANNNPRDMRMILTAVRDVAYTGKVDLNKAFAWAGLSYDGLTTVAQDMLLVLLMSKDNTCSIDSLKAQLGEPGPLRHHEQLLLQKGLLTVTGRGRVLTEDGIARAEKLVEERMG